MSNINNQSLDSLSNEDIVFEYQNGNKEAIGTLYVRFIGLIHKMVYDHLKEYHIPQMYFDDLFDAGVDSLFKAVEKFTKKEECLFISFWWAICLRSLISVSRKIIGDRLFFFDPQVLDTVDFELKDNSVIDYDNDENFIAEIVEKNQDAFTKKELKYLKLYLDGYETLEIASLLGLSRSAIYRIRKYVLSKLNKIIKSN